MKITTNEAIAAIYYALWQTDYPYAALARDEAHMAALAAQKADAPYPFFAQVRQNTCEAYAFWPRAALLETATCHLDAQRSCFVDFEGLRRKIMSMPNVTDEERNGAFWQWLGDFPAALAEVLHSVGFRRYMAWREEWVQQQNRRFASELTQLERLIAVCREQYHSPMTQVQLLIDPIKCVYSADYYTEGEIFVFSSGRFLCESVIHEFLHHAVHPVLEGLARKVKPRTYPELDESYYAAGSLYAFEEHAVRQLTKLALVDALPADLPAYLSGLL